MPSNSIAMVPCLIPADRSMSLAVSPRIARSKDRNSMQNKIRGSQVIMSISNTCLGAHHPIPVMVKGMHEHSVRVHRYTDFNLSVPDPICISSTPWLTQQASELVVLRMFGVWRLSRSNNKNAYHCTIGHCVRIVSVVSAHPMILRHV